MYGVCISSALTDVLGSLTSLLCLESCVLLTLLLLLL